MVINFLSSLFEIVYSDIHKSEQNLTKTVMFAFDDAICGVAGKAGPGRIFDIDHNEAPFRKMFASYSSFYIEENDYPGFAAWLRELPSQLGINNITWAAAPAPGVKTISLCESIFRIEDLNLSKIYIDVENCIIQDENDALDIINYPYSRRTFILSQFPVALEKVRQRRGITE
jgi:hypothetical protein